MFHLPFCLYLVHCVLNTRVSIIMHGCMLAMGNSFLDGISASILCIICVLYTLQHI